MSSSHRLATFPADLHLLDVFNPSSIPNVVTGVLSAQPVGLRVPSVDQTGRIPAAPGQLKRDRMAGHDLLARQLTTASVLHGPTFSGSSV